MKTLKEMVDEKLENVMPSQRPTVRRIMMQGVAVATEWLFELGKNGVPKAQAEKQTDEAFDAAQ